MIYFTYKLQWKDGSGYQPKTDVSQTWLDIGHAQQEDGTMVGYSEKPIKEAFTEQDIKDFSITEISSDEAIQQFKNHGANEPVIDKTGKCIDTSPPYIENRGVKYVESLEASAMKTDPSIVKETL